MAGRRKWALLPVAAEARHPFPVRRPSRTSMGAPRHPPCPTGGHRAVIRRSDPVFARVATVDLGLRGRAAFVAASSKGMGRAIAERFAAEGADVGMCARSEATLQAAADSVRAHGVRVVATPADVADAEQIKSAIDRTVSELGRLDALVVNAGGPPRGVFAELDEDKWEAAH